MNAACITLEAIRARIAAAGGPARTAATLLAVSKNQPASAVRALAACGQLRFGENYVQEALAKQRELADPGLQWHLIGALQSNKCREVAQHFDWLESLDRARLIPLLDAARPPTLPPLNVLIQVNIDAEASKSGCAPEQVAGLAGRVAQAPRLSLRGLMAIPAPAAERTQRADAFRRMRMLFDTLRAQYPGIDTLSMGMSDDFELAIACGATEVRVGSALFGPRV